jgi:hypothetical protein
MSGQDFPESDWKLLRKVYEAAFDRFCRDSLKKAEAVIDEQALTPSDRFEKLSKFIKSQNKDLNSIFYTFNFSHSNAIMILSILYNWELVTPDELNQFNPSIQSRIKGGIE